MYMMCGRFGSNPGRAVLYALGFTILALASVSCSKITDTGGGQAVELKLSSVTSCEMQTKAVIEGTDFPLEGVIGLSLFNDENGNTSYGDCSNLSFGYNQTESKWISKTSVSISNTVYAFAYYPYLGDDFKSIHNIPVASSLNGDDVMYASTQVTVQDARNVSLTMKHALACISIELKKDASYTGDASLTGITLKGDGIAASGTLDIATGGITATKADVSATVSNCRLSNQPVTEDLLIVPVAIDNPDARQTVELWLTIDGHSMGLTFDGENGIRIKSGVKSTISITLTSSGVIGMLPELEHVVL